MKKNIGIITFHASYNYGSMLQAYALQQSLLKMGHECEVINFRTKRQREFYKPLFLKGNLFNRVKRSIMYLPYLKSLQKRQNLFESYLKDEIKLSAREYESEEQLAAANLPYGYFISGGDQIWNPSCFDFDWAYFLSFVKSGKKIAYAPSMGPDSAICFPEKIVARMKPLLMGYDHISVREPQGSQHIQTIISKNIETVLDPVFLLPPEFWAEKAGNTPLIKGEYIYVYSPNPNAEVFNYAKKLSKQLNCKIIVSQIFNSTKENLKIRYSPIKYFLEVGPKEFLNLCKYATCIVGGSFHLIAFSLLLHKPFFTAGGENDDRISNILKLTGMELRNINRYVVSDIKQIFSIDFDKIDGMLLKERDRSWNYLINSLK